MKKIYQKYFSVSENEHISDKVFMARITLSIALIMLCVCALCATTYAHFTAGVDAGGSVTAGNFSLKITVDGTTIDNSVTQTLTAGEHEIVIVKQGSAKSGFCVLEIGSDANGKPLHTLFTQPLVDDVAGIDMDTITFKLVMAEDTTVKFEPHWGKASSYPEKYVKGPGEVYYIDNDNLKIEIANLPQPSASTNTGSDDTTGGETGGTTPDSTVTNDSGIDLQSEDDVVEPDNTEPDNTEPDNTEPDNTEPDNTEPDNTEPDNTEPDNTEPDNTEPDNTEPDNTEPEPVDETETVHVVQSGETLYGIAKLYGINYHLIADYNGIKSPYTLATGQKLIIPKTE